MLLFTGCESTQKSESNTDNYNVLYFITPRNVDYGWGDLGIYRYTIEEEKITSDYENRTFNVKNYRDIVFEFYYSYDSISIDSLNNSMKPLPDNFRIGTPRILMVINGGMKTDTLKIDSDYHVEFRGDIYKCLDYLKNKLHSNMPDDIRENWELNLSTSPIDDPTVKKIAVPIEKS